MEQRKDDPTLVRWTGGYTVLGPLADEPEAHQFTILPEHRALRLVWQNGKIDHAVVQDLGNSTTVKIFANSFIVTCGSMLTPQLLWASGIRPDALGRYLNENPITGSKVILSRDIVEEARSLPGNTAKDDAIPIPMDWPEPMIWIPPSSGRPWHVQMHRDGRRTKYDGTVDFRLVIDLGWSGMVEPRADNRIMFSDEYQDHFGMPQPTFEYSLSEDDAKRAHEMEKEMLDAAETLGGFHPIAGQPDFSDKGGSIHFQSTVRMGDKPDDSVVDVNAKVWGFDNLYLGTVGVIPTKMAANPTLTASAIAIRAAYKMLGKDVPPASMFQKR